MEKKTRESKEDLISVLRDYTGKDDLGIQENGDEVEISPVVAQRKQEILEAALNVFSKKGFDGSRTKEIATEAGVSEATVFKYFPTKQNILSSLIKPVIESIAKPIFLAPVMKIIDNAGTVGLEKTLVLLMKDRLDVFEKNERLMRTMLLELGRQEDLQEAFGQLVFPLITVEIRRLYEASRARGEIAEHIDESTFCRNFLAMVIGNIALMKAVPGIFGVQDAQSEIEKSVRLFVHGLQGEK
jgi:AcrR family transcriptional regulator